MSQSAEKDVPDGAITEEQYADIWERGAALAQRADWEREQRARVTSPG